MGLAVNKHLNAIGHTGPRILVHSDLGRIEWQDSLPKCEELAAHLGWELMIVRRNAGDMVDRWQGRWKNNMARYADLSCVKTILPWSTPSMRFCIELKTQIILSALKKRFPHHDVLNVTGIRREESSNRAKAAVSKPQPELKRKKTGLIGFDWNAIIEYKLDDVLGAMASVGLALHEGYTTYGVSRISCVYCIMSAEADLMASAGCVDNQDVYVELVELEVASTFGFQGNRWLADVAPHLLPQDLRERVGIAKDRGRQRQLIEARIPADLMYVKECPTRVPTLEEAAVIASVRRDIGALLNIDVQFTTAEGVVGRYAELIAERAEKDRLAAAKELAAAARAGRRQASPSLVPVVDVPVDVNVSEDTADDDAENEEEVSNFGGCRG